MDTNGPHIEHAVEVHILHRHVPASIALTALIAVVIGISFLIYNELGIAEYRIFVGEPERGAAALQYGSWPALEDRNFFEDVKHRFIAERADFVEADLSLMTLRVYHKGEPAHEVKILSKGKEGSWWETPAGLYRVEAKEENHYSSFGGVYMPWSMPFQGNFFIHGWPYYPGGAQVAEGYSGGCIRLSTLDAELVYREVEPGMPILVFEGDFRSDGFAYAPRVPSINAKSYLVADLKSNFVFAERRPGDVLPLASLTKLMTAIVATEYINIEKSVRVPAAALVPTSRPRLTAGAVYTLFDLLHPLLMESSNEAAEAIRAMRSVDDFVELMNRKAQAIGMKNTAFVDVSGSGAENVGTARDLFTLAKYLYNNRSFILHLTRSGASDSVYGESAFSDLGNFNIFHAHPEFVGGKTGRTTAARGTLVAVFEMPIQDEKRPIVFIILGSENEEEEAVKLLTWFKINY